MICVQCGADLPEASAFCNACGAAQPAPQASEGIRADTEPITPPALADSDNPPAPTKGRHGVLTAVVAALCVALLAAAGIGWKLYSDDRAQKAEAKRVAIARRVAAEEEATRKARLAEATKLMVVLEKTQTAVSVGLTLDELSDLVKDDQAAVMSFIRSEYSGDMPKFAGTASRVADLYLQSARHWDDAKKAATEKWDAAWNKYIYGGGKKPGDISSFLNDKHYQKDWSDASDAMLEATKYMYEEGQPTTTK